jgi:GxxExxY protein
MKPLRARGDAEKDINEVSGAVVDAALTVHRQLGPGLLESAYEVCLKYELGKRGISVRSQVELPVVYDSVRIDVGYRLDLLVEECVVVEIKAVTKVMPVHEAQLLSYLKLGNFKVGLLINFNVLRIKDGIKRMVNQL